MEPQYQHHEGRWARRMVVGIVLLTCVRVWIGPVRLAEPVYAQVADPAMQRNKLLEEARRTNQLLTEIRQLLETHTFNVRMQGADNPADRPAADRPVPGRNDR